MGPILLTLDVQHTGNGTQLTSMSQVNTQSSRSVTWHLIIPFSRCIAVPGSTRRVRLYACGLRMLHVRLNMSLHRTALLDGEYGTERAASPDKKISVRRDLPLLSYLHAWASAVTYTSPQSFPKTMLPTYKKVTQW